MNIENPLVGKITRDPTKVDANSFLVSENGIPKIPDRMYLGMLTTDKEISTSNNTPIVYNIPTLDHLSEGDLITVGVDGNINTLYRIHSTHNTLLATERCNSNCLMCSQPPKDRDDVPYSFWVHQKLIPLLPKDCPEIGISGGEPTLMGEYFYKLIEQLKVELPNTEVHVLTNGRSFAWLHLADRLAKINHERVMLGIPVYSDYYQIHDYIVQAPHAFNQTILISIR